MDFMGYSRSDGRIGTRNYVGIITTVVCAIEVAEAISRKVRETTFFIHQQGCCQTPVDINRVQDTLINLGKNPNLASVLLVSLGCESTVVEEVAKAIGEVGKRVETIIIQEIRGAARSIVEGTLIAQDMVTEASKISRVPCQGRKNRSKNY